MTTAISTSDLIIGDPPPCIPDDADHSSGLSVPPSACARQGADDHSRMFSISYSPSRANPVKHVALGDGAGLMHFFSRCRAASLPAALAIDSMVV